MDSKRNERAEQWRRQNRTDAVLVNAAAVKGAHTMCATVTASPTPAKIVNLCVTRIYNYYQTQLVRLGVENILILCNGFMQPL